MPPLRRAAEQGFDGDVIRCRPFNWTASSRWMAPPNLSRRSGMVDAVQANARPGGTDLPFQSATLRAYGKILPANCRPLRAAGA